MPATSRLICALAVVGASCATTTHYARRPEAERSSFLAARALRPGMTLHDVVVTMINARLANQYVALSSGAVCPDTSTQVILHAGERLAKIGRTTVYAAGFASIQVYRRADASLTSHGYERQGPFLEAVHARQKDLLCPEVSLSFDSTVEGGCGSDTILLTFDADGRVGAVGPVRGGQCAAQTLEAPSNNGMQLTSGGSMRASRASLMRRLQLIPVFYGRNRRRP